MGFDVVIVGAGTAGSVLAARLSEDPSRSVCLIEAGGPATDPDISDPAKWPALEGRAIDWRFETTAQAGTAGRRHAWARGRVVGGSSALNAMAHVRGHPSDFEAWAAAGCTGWGYADLMPYFIRSETSDRSDSPYHGGGGPVRLVTPEDPHALTRGYMAAAESLGLAPTDEHNGARMTGPTLNSLTIVAGQRQSTADAYLVPALRRPNLTLLSAGLVDRLVLSAGARCRGVEFIEDGRRRTVEADRGVVLCAGVIGTPAILLRSGIGPAADLRELGIEVRGDLPGVGRNLHDHLLARANLYRAKRPVPPSRYQHSESLLYIGHTADSPLPEIALACVLAPVTTERFEAPAFGEAYSLLFGITHPRSRGTLKLRSTDPGAAPLIDPNYLAEAYDRETLLTSLGWAQEVGAAGDLDDWRGAEILPGPDVRTREDRLDFLAQTAATHHHPVGTCRMGTDGAAVVDPVLRVRGFEGLHVVDASVIPRITAGPVNAAVIAIAERASDLLRGEPPLAPFEPRRPDS